MRKDIIIITRRTESSVQRGQKIAREFGYDWYDKQTMHLSDFHLDTSKDAVVLCLDNEEADGVLTYCEYEYFFDGDTLYPRWEDYTIIDIRNSDFLMETE